MVLLFVNLCASVNAQSIYAVLNGIDVYVVGGGGLSKVNAPNILYNDRTYIPLRAVSEALDKTVNYDESTSSAYITSEKQNAFQKITENDPLSSVYSCDKQFKKYQNLIYLLKYDWFSSGLFGINLEQGSEYDTGYEPFFTAENTLAFPIYDISLWGYKNGKKDGFSISSGYSRQNINTKNTLLLNRVNGIQNIINDLDNNDYYVSHVRFRYDTETNGFNASIMVTYNLENETQEIEVTVYAGFPYTETKAINLTYQVLTDRDYLITPPLVRSEETIDATFDSINVYVNGTYIDAPNILYNNRTYIPLRAISEALGVAVTYDEDTNEVYLGMTQASGEYVESAPEPEQLIQSPISDKKGNNNLKYLVDNPQYLEDLFGVNIEIEMGLSNPIMYFINKAGNENIKLNGLQMVSVSGRNVTHQGITGKDFEPVSINQKSDFAHASASSIAELENTDIRSIRVGILVAEAISYRNSPDRSYRDENGIIRFREDVPAKYAILKYDFIEDTYTWTYDGTSTTYTRDEWEANAQ